MQLDQAQFHKVKADASLEKPFDSEGLRAVIEKFVPKLNSFPLKGLLKTPGLPDFEESDTFIRQKSQYATASATDASSQDQNQNTKTFEIEEVEDEFSMGDMNHKKLQEADDWSTSSANQFVVETESFGDFEEVTVVNSRPNSAPDLQKRIQDQVNTYLEDSPVAQSKSQNQSMGKVSNNLDEKLFREEVRQMAERICWQVIPEITEKIVREELGKLLKDLDKSI